MLLGSCLMTYLEGRRYSHPRLPPTPQAAPQPPLLGENQGGAAKGGSSAPRGGRGRPPTRSSAQSEAGMGALGELQEAQPGLWQLPAGSRWGQSPVGALGAQRGESGGELSTGPPPGPPPGCVRGALPESRWHETWQGEQGKAFIIIQIYGKIDWKQ